jgi:hypothetical protein
MRTCALGIIFWASLLASPAASAGPGLNVTGTWQTIVPVTMSSYTPSAADPTTGSYQGVGSTLWQGTWSGLTDYTIRGTANLVTGAGAGSITETFAGRSSDGKSGTIRFGETYALDATGHLRIRARVLDATGQFTGGHGSVTFVGTMVGIATGSGSYRGRWVQQRR